MIIDAKRAAVEQWTADPCGPAVAGEEPGTRGYFERVLTARGDYAPWMAEVLRYEDWSGQRVLDVGCGQGIDAARYAMAGAIATGVDLTPRHVSLARAHLASLSLDCEIVNADAEALPFEDDTFDRASSNGVLHHTPDMSAALREIRRVLRPGGEACIIVYNKRSLHYWVEQVLRHGLLEGKLLRERSMAGVLSSSVERSSVGARPLVRVYTAGQLKRHLLQAGFSTVRTRVRHFNIGDTFITSGLGRLVPLLNDARVRGALGRAGGWYLIADAINGKRGSLLR